MDNDSSLSGLSLCEAAQQSTVLTAPWRNANTAKSEWRWWRCWWVFGIYNIGLRCPFKTERFTGLGLGWSLDEAHTAPGWGWDPLDTYAFLCSTTMEHMACTQPTWPCLIVKVGCTHFCVFTTRPNASYSDYPHMFGIIYLTHSSPAVKCFFTGSFYFIFQFI